MNDEQRQLAGNAWQAYNAMQTTKQRHFDYLTILEDKKRNFNIDPTDDDQVFLKQLLRDHDEQVAAFTEASAKLKASDPATHLALFKYIGDLNESMSDPSLAH